MWNATDFHCNLFLWKYDWKMRNATGHQVEYLAISPSTTVWNSSSFSSLSLVDFSGTVDTLDEVEASIAWRLGRLLTRPRIWNQKTWSAKVLFGGLSVQQQPVWFRILASAEKRDRLLRGATVTQHSLSHQSSFWPDVTALHSNNSTLIKARTNGIGAKEKTKILRNWRSPKQRCVIGQHSDTAPHILLIVWVGGWR